MKIQVETKRYLNLQASPKNIAETLDIEVSNHAYLPIIDDLSSDWVAYIAVPAFKLIREQAGQTISSFCSIGTGSGLDVLAAAELLGAHRLGFTDLQQDVVDVAKRNISLNLKGKAILEYGAGDLLSPLKGKPRYDVIYENLPNVPLAVNTAINDNRNSGHFLEKRQEVIPALVHEHMLDLHYLALVQAKAYLTDQGAVYSTLGARVPLHVFEKLGQLAGYQAEILTYTWKVQAEAKDVLTGYAQQEKEGLGPFHFYRASDLKAAFANLDVETSGVRALDLEKLLAPKQLSATQALAAWKQGAVIGHTVAVLKSSQKA